MPAYFLGTVDVDDPVEYQKYLDGFMASMQPFGGRVLVATTDIEVIEGQWPKARTVVLEFPTRAAIREWYDSAPYQKILHHRLRSANAHLVVAEGPSARKE